MLYIFIPWTCWTYFRSNTLVYRKYRYEYLVTSVFWVITNGVECKCIFVVLLVWISKIVCNEKIETCNQIFHGKIFITWYSFISSSMHTSLNFFIIKSYFVNKHINPHCLLLLIIKLLCYVLCFVQRLIFYLIFICTKFLNMFLW